MMDVFDGMVYKNVAISIDNILVFGKTFEEYLRALSSFESLVKANIKVNPLITDIWARKITLTGKTSLQKGIR